MKILENSGRPFDNSAVRKKYSAGKISVNDFSAIRPKMADLILGQMLCPHYRDVKREKIQERAYLQQQDFS